MKQSKMYCGKDINQKVSYWHFYHNPLSVKVCGHKKNEIIEVLVQESEESSECYWGWWDNKEQKFNFVYPKKCLVTMCFPYSIEVYENRGDGKLLPVKILEI